MQENNILQNFEDSIKEEYLKLPLGQIKKWIDKNEQQAIELLIDRKYSLKKLIRKYRLNGNDFQILRLFLTGLSLQAIGDMLGLPKSTVYARIKNQLAPIIAAVVTGVIEQGELEKVYVSLPAKTERLQKKTNKKKKLKRIALQQHKIIRRKIKDLDPDPIIDEQESGFATIYLLVKLQNVLTEALEKIKEEEELGKINSVQSKSLLVKVAAELRAQIDTYVKMLEKVYNIYAIAEFQQEVLEAIGEVASDVRDKILARLKQRNVVRKLLSVPVPKVGQQNQAIDIQSQNGDGGDD